MTPPPVDGAPRGVLISVEGLDGAGKTTQAAALTASLAGEGRDVVGVRPAGTWLGGLLEGALLHGSLPSLEPWTEALLFTAARVQLLAEVIRPALARGAVVVADRFVDSTIAYQGGGRGLPPDELWRLHGAACAGLLPDITVLLELSPAAAARRRRGTELPLDRIEGSPGDFHSAVARCFDELARAEPHRILRVDADRPPSEVSADVTRLVGERLPRRP